MYVVLHKICSMLWTLGKPPNQIQLSSFLLIRGQLENIIQLQSYKPLAGAHTAQCTATAGAGDEAEADTFIQIQPQQRHTLHWPPKPKCWVAFLKLDNDKKEERNI